MTTVHVSMARDDGTGTLAAVAGSLYWEPTTRREDGTVVVLPQGFPMSLVAGEASEEVAPSGLTWCWRVTERVEDGTVRYVAVPDSAETVEYTDLVDVDPDTLVAWTPADPEAAYLAALADLGSQTYASLDDVDPTGLADGDAMVWDATAEKWVRVSLSDTYVAQTAIGGMVAPSLTDVTVTAIGASDVIALDVWGGYLWGKGLGEAGKSIYRSDDDGATWSLYTDTYPAGTTIYRVLPTSDGEVVVCDAAAIRKSTGWAAGGAGITWTTKATPNGTCQFQIWGFDGDAAGTKFISTEYSSTRADSRYVRMSLDSGDTWAVAYDSVTVHGATLADGSHLHACCYDEWGDRWYISEGHDDGGTVGDVAGLYCSDDDGVTWARATLMAQDPAPTVLVATDAGLVCGTDNSLNGLWGVLRRDDPADEELVQTWTWSTGRDGLVGFAKRGFRDSTTGMVYVSFTSNYDDVAPIIAAGTPTTGGLVYTWTGVHAANDFITAVVLPSRDRLWAYAYSNGGSDRYLIAARAGAPGADHGRDTGTVLGGTAQLGTSVAVGPRSTTGTASRSTAVGVSASATATQDSTAVGHGATAGLDGVAVGSAAVAYSYGVAIGKGATTGATSGENLAIGAGAACTSTGATAIGRNASSGNASTSVGAHANASGAGATAVGYGAVASHTRSVSLRDATTANYQIQGGARHIELKEVASAPSAAPADSVRLYAIDNGAGKTQLVCIFASGAVQVIATEP